MASSEASARSHDTVRRRRDPNRSAYVTLGAVRYAVRRAPPARCPCRCCASGELLAACLGRDNTLDRLQRFRWRSAERERARAASPDRRDRAERLRELTERLRGARAPPAPPDPPPVPPPRTRHSKGSPTREPSLCCASPPVADRVDSHNEDFFDADDIRLVKVEPRSIVGSYAQKTIPFRSASFSQGDSATDKYYRGIATVKQPSIFDFGRRPESKSTDAAARESAEPLLAPPEIEESTECGSTASVDSAVGSDEGLLAHSSPAPRSQPPDSPHKLGARSLTHPLPRRGSQDRSVPGGSLQFLTSPPVLHEVREESDASLADSAQPHSEAVSPSDSTSPFRFPTTEPSERCPNVDCGCSSSRVLVANASGEMREAVACATPVPLPVYECIVKEWCSSVDETDREADETITSEQLDSLLAAVQNPTATPAVAIAPSNKERRRSHDKMKRRKGIYITNEVNLEELPEPLVNGQYRKCDDARADPRDSLTSEARTNSSAFGDKSDDSTANGPPSPGEVVPSVWLKLDTETQRRRFRLSHQSSDERDDDCVRLRRSGNIFLRTESPSDGESESGVSRGRTSSPSPAHITPDASDVEVRRTVRPVRGPYLRNVLDASPTLRPNRSFDERETNRRSYSDATVPQRKASAGAAARAAPTHVRATSSPSKLSELRSGSAGAEVLAALLQGSSEAFSNTNSFANVILCQKQHNDTRTHVVVELYDTEKSYVEALQTIVKKYLQPLKSSENSGLVDPWLVDEIFYQVPSILAVHEVFLEELRRRLEQWDVHQKVGDVFLNVFAKPSVMETYMLFINNWKKAKETIKSTKSSRPAFAKFLDTMARDHKGKLSLDNLLIKPVQKFPSYKLLLERLIKHTDSAHPDHKLLLEAQKEIHELLLRINCTERESLELEQQQLTLRELEHLIEGLSNLVTQERTFVCHELVSMPSASGATKERCVFLFTDLVIVTSVKRRTGTIKRPIPTYQSSAASNLEGSKYKLLMRIALTDLQVLKAKDERTRQVLQEVETLTEDVTVLTQISDLVAALHVRHSVLEETVRELLVQTSRQLSDRQSGDTQLCRLELSVDTRVGVENLTLIFSKTESRSKWETLINETKQKLCTSGQERPAPEFLSPVPIRKTRAGLQFTCAAPTIPHPGHAPDVWVCNSDGYVGQVCVLTLSPRPQVTSCNGVCNARILCVACIPAFPLKHDLDIPLGSSAGSTTKPEISISDTNETCKNIRLDSSSSSDEDDDASSTSENQDTALQDPAPARGFLNHTLAPLHCKSLSTPHTTQNTVHPVMKSSSNPAVDKQAMGISTGTFSSPASRQSSEDSGGGLNQPTMWLGTEDGYIHVYNCNDNIRIKKNKVKLQHNSTVLRIVYADSKVFVALGSGDMVVYVRDIDGAWTEQCTLSVGTGSSPVTSTLLYNGRLWCATHTTIKIVNPHTLTVEDAFQVGTDTLKPISHMAVHGAGIWLSLHNTAQLKCFRARSREQLADINITPFVTKMLHGCDDIIRQHKAACLRVTSLLARDHTLWIGTSAGVLLNAPLHNSPDANGVFSVPQIIGVNYGHTGHVRFLTVVETPAQSIQKPQQAVSKSKVLHRRSANLQLQKPPEATSSTDVLVISGGDGFEDFRSSTSNEDAGREDSTNHLLLWRV